MVPRPSAHGKDDQMNEDSAGNRRWPGGLGQAAAVAAVAALAAAVLLAAACSGGGGSHLAGSAATPAQDTVQQLDIFAQCMRSDGEPNFYFANPQSTPNPSATVLEFMGQQVIGIDPQTAQFASAMKSCKHLLPGGGPKPITQKQLNSMLGFAACMRAHGFPGYPDPQRGPNGGVVQQPLPSSVDTSSPQFQAAEKACGEGP
jgi:hypothetical protein